MIVHDNTQFIEEEIIIWEKTANVWKWKENQSDKMKNELRMTYCMFLSKSGQV